MSWRPTNSDSRQRPLANRGALRVLVVEDDYPVLAVTCAMLERLNHVPVPVNTGAKAIKLLEAEGAGFDLAVVDTKMSGINGNDVRRYIDMHLPNLKVITASGSPPWFWPERTDGEVGRHIFLRKPYHMHQLRDAIQRLMAEEKSKGDQELRT